MRLHLPTLRGRLHWPLPLPLIAAVLAVGIALLYVAIVIRRRFSSPIAAYLALAAAAVWNAGIVFAFMSPHNRHVFYLATHHASVVVNAILGFIWLSLFVFAVVKWFRRP